MNRVGIGSHGLAESVPWNRFPGLQKTLQNTASGLLNCLRVQFDLRCVVEGVLHNGILTLSSTDDAPQIRTFLNLKGQKGTPWINSGKN